MIIKWRCPKCGIGPKECKGKARENCKASHGCSGFICECPVDAEAHGTTHADPCTDAACYHCGWAGTFPIPPRGIKKWEREALAAGWTPPAGWQAGIKGAGA